MKTRACLASLALLLWVLAACAAPVEEEEPPTPTRRLRSSGTATPIPVLIVNAVGSPEALPASAPSAGACSLETLPVGLHISARGSYTETETAAAGSMLCRIQRDSCAYRRLIGNMDPDILFYRHKPPPLDAEDTLMHPAMLLPLTRLKERVMAEWGGAVRLFVTAAFDSLLEHDLAQTDASRKYSLHFEGRSVDFVTYPVEPARYARLCALAHCAGFDFVHNEGDHCHASIRADSLCTVCSGAKP